MLFSIFIRATLKGKNMLLMGSIFFPLIVASFKALKSTLHCISWFIDIDTKIYSTKKVKEIS